MNLPIVIQGGMGVAISDWRLARAVSLTGQMGVVSGTGLSGILINRLMDGDITGNIRRALSNFPLPEIAQKIIDKYYVPGGKTTEEHYKTPPVYTVNPSPFLDQLTAVANYVEVFLAKEGHSGLVGINLMEKLQLSNLSSLYGAMLGGVDYVLMGAGIPTQIPKIMDMLSLQLSVSYRLNVHGAAPEEDHHISFDPEKVFPGISKLLPKINRPKFLPIISSNILAISLLKKSDSQIDGFIIEGPTAGGHNAPPRGPMNLNEKGEPIYGDKDKVDLEKMKQLGLPFWLAGGYGHPDKVKSALAAGAAGVQVGSAFALCKESGMQPDLKKKLLQKILSGEATVKTSPLVSPTGFPFKVAALEGTLSEMETYNARPRICDLGFLTTAYKKEDGTVGYRCPAEPIENYIRKGGKLEDTEGRCCLCNNLIATAGFPQKRKNGYVELPIITTGDDLSMVKEIIKPGETEYTAEDVVNYLLDKK
jgi:nitronate monooxygenase